MCELQQTQNVHKMYYLKKMFKFNLKVKKNIIFKNHLYSLTFYIYLCVLVFSKREFTLFLQKIYVVISAPQVGKKSGATASSVDFWLRENGTDIPNSNVRCVLRTNENKDVVVNQTMMPFSAGDTLNVMMAVEKTGEGLGIEAIKTEGRPLIPSIIFSMHHRLILNFEICK